MRKLVLLRFQQKKEVGFLHQLPLTHTTHEHFDKILNLTVIKGYQFVFNYLEFLQNVHQRPVHATSSEVCAICFSILPVNIVDYSLLAKPLNLTPPELVRHVG